MTDISLLSLCAHPRSALRTPSVTSVRPENSSVRPRSCATNRCASSVRTILHQCSQCTFAEIPGLNYLNVMYFLPFSHQNSYFGGKILKNGRPSNFLKCERISIPRTYLKSLVFALVILCVPFRSTRVIHELRSAGMCEALGPQRSTQVHTTAGIGLNS